VTEVVEKRMRQRLLGNTETISWIQGRVDELESGSVTPYVVADDLLKRFGHLVTGAIT
jgi:LAO/AO transport system kinase